ncbi:DUF6404 family protein [Lysobacter korlensis]|uniref:DUF6404 family protein n=1 Tax=Lysobacter korlensis TaxID=553636 RepID=A0ABV6S0Y1_9GAMM
MTHHEKLAAMHQHMIAIGVPASTAAPLAWRLLWRLGVEVPPPLFVPFATGALAMSGAFALVWGLLMWGLFWARQGMPASSVVAAALAAGALVGISMAAYFRHLARKHNLPSWAEYTGAPTRV